MEWFLKNPHATNEELLSALMARIKGPDFPTGAQILGTKGIEDAYRTGRGSITMRAVVNGSSGIAVGMATNIPPHNLRGVETPAMSSFYQFIGRFLSMRERPASSKSRAPSTYAEKHLIQQYPR